MKRKSFLPQKLHARRRPLRLKRIVTLTLTLFSLATRASFPQENPSDPRQLYQQALADTNLTQRVRLLEAALQAAPQALDVRIELGKTLLALKQPQTALDHFDIALSRGSTNPLLWYYKGLAHHQLKQYPPALRSLRIALSMQKERADFLLTLGQVQLDSNAPQEALQAFEQALTFTANEEEQYRAWLWKARAYEVLNDTTGASRSYRQILRLQPNDAEARAKLLRWENFRRAQALFDSAKALLSQREFDKALAQLQNAFLLAASRADEIQNLVTQIETEKARELKPVSALPIGAEKGSSSPNGGSLAPLTEPRKDPIFTNGGKDSTIGLTQQATSGQGAGTSKIDDSKSISPFALAGAIIAVILILAVLFFLRHKLFPPRIPGPGPDPPLLPLRELIAKVWNEKSASFQRPKHDPLAGHPRYRIELEVGRGGMGNVYKALDTKLNRHVALKVMASSNVARNEKAAAQLIARFHQEIKITATLENNHIVTLYDADEWRGQLFYTMQYVLGISLRDLLLAQARLGHTDALHLVRQTCTALQYAHRQAVLHRDISPENLMLTLSGDVMVLDFGIALLQRKEEGRLVTITELNPGKPGYASPEQTMHTAKLDQRTDIFSLGVVFYEMLAGQRPEVWPSRIDPPLKKNQLDLPKRTIAILNKMLAVDLERRQPDVETLLRELNTLATKRGGSAMR